MDLLSIFIPTYKRADMLNRLLNSICVGNKGVLDCFEGVIKIHISNNCAEDLATKQVVENWQKVNKNIFYHENARNIGIDANHDKMYSYCDSKYCIMIADDDIFMPNKLGTVIEWCKRGEFIFGVCNGYWYMDDKIFGPQIYNCSEPLICTCYELLTKFIYDVIPGKVVPLLPFYGGLCANIEYVRNIFDEKQRNIFAGTMHQYIGVLWNAMLYDNRNVGWVSDDPIVIINTMGKTWNAEAEELIRNKIPKFYSLLAVPDTLKKLLIEHYEKFYLENMLNEIKG